MKYNSVYDDMNRDVYTDVSNRNTDNVNPIIWDIIDEKIRSQKLFAVNDIKSFLRLDIRLEIGHET